MRRSEALVWFFVGLLVQPVWAALTTAQVSEHFGRLIRRGFAQDLASAEQEQMLIRVIAVYAKDWVPNGSFGTLADRREAVQTIFREIYQAQTGRDGTQGTEADGASGRHTYKRHYLRDIAGLSASEVDSIEP